MLGNIYEGYNSYAELYRIYGALNSRFYPDLSDSEKSELAHNYLEFKYQTSKEDG